MIKEIKIENFKSIQSLNLELGRLNVFIGANGSGKSNILEGIGMGSAASEDLLHDEFLSSRGIRVTSPRSMRSGFQSNTLKEDIQISFSHLVFGEISYSLSNENQQYSRWVNNGVPFEEHIRHYLKEQGLIAKDKESGNVREASVAEIDSLVNEAINKNKALGKKMRIQGLSNFLIFAPENYFLRRFEEETQIKPLGIKGEGLFSHLVYVFRKKNDSFRKINESLQLFDWFDGFEIPDNLMFTERRIKIKDHYLEKGLRYFDQKSANEGFLYLLFYLTLFISDETPKFFAIDNIDNAMNPKMGDELVHLLAKLSKEHDKQVILTTHNPSVLDGLDLSDDDQRLFVISRNKKGHTQALRVPHRESDERLSYRFIRGSIGGLPKNF